MRSRILYLALADARGHLMRAHLLRGVLAPCGIHVDILTTSRQGQAFLESLGTPSAVLSEHFRVVFDGCHDMSRDKTDRNIRDYYLDPRRALRDVGRLRDLAEGADLVVDDSLHPALLVAPLLPGNRMRVVHVFGENIWRAAEQNLEGRAGPVVEALYPRALWRMREAAFACVVHTPHPRAADAHTYEVPPIIGAPARSARVVRAALGVGRGERLAAVYLNPHFTEPAVATAIERALQTHGYRLAAVGEGYADRASWSATDADFASVVAAADLYVSGAGMGALAQSRAFGTPLVALLGNQPEQIDNARDARATHGAFAAVNLAASNLEAALSEAIASLGVRGTQSSVEAIHEQWANVFVELIERARKENGNDRAHVFPRRRDQQPAWRGSRTVSGSRRPAASLDASSNADLAARSLAGARHHA